MHSLDHYRETSRERELTAAEALKYLTHPDTAGGTPGCHWGRHSDDVAPVAVELARIYGEVNGDPMSTDLLDGCMAGVINSSDGVGELLWEYASETFREEWADELADYEPRESISSGHFSTDLQARDAMRWLEEFAPDKFGEVLADFPEYPRAVMGLHSSWWDTEEMGVDEEWGSWLVDRIEATGLVMWEDGEPWAYPSRITPAPNA